MFSPKRIFSFSLDGSPRAARLALATCSLACLGMAQVTHTVNPGGGGAGIQAAINGAASGDIIFFNPGVYDLSTTRVDLLSKNLTLRGALPSGSAILDGVSAFGAPLLRIAGNQNNTTIVEHLTFRNGYAQDGGAILVSGATPLIRNDFFRNNRADVNGGAVFIELDTPQMRLSRCEFDNNEALSGNGGGVFITRGGPGPVGQPGPVVLFVQLSRFNNNRALAGLGGGLCMMGTELYPESVHVEKTKFLINRATQGGGVYSFFSLLEVLRSEFSSNSAEDSFGGLGGGITAHDSELLSIRNSTLQNNAATGPAALGGGVFISDLADIQGTAPYDFHNNLLVSNTAAQGGGLAIEDAFVNVKFCTLSANAAPGGGGGIYRNAPASEVTNVDYSVLYSNTSTVPAVSQIVTVAGGIVSTYSFIGPTGFFAGTMNSPGNPLFVAPPGGYTCNYSPNGMFFLQPASPCVDYSNLTYAQSGLPGFPSTPWSTSTSGAGDMGNADVGFHYPPLGCP